MLKEIIAKQAQKHDSFYLYDESRILENIGRLKASFPQIHFLYSIKCNPHPRVLGSILGQGFGADAASLAEVLAAHDLGLPREEIYYSAPGKTQGDIEGSLDKAVLIADSIDEIRRIQSTAEQRGATVSIGIRVNPDFTFAGDKGQPSKFGIDEDQALAFLREAPCKNVKVTGIHVHLKSQELDPAVLSGYYKKMLRLGERFQEATGGLEYLNMGSGIGVAYAPGDVPLDLALLGGTAREGLEAFRARFPRTRLIIEVGRYAVCQSGVYVTTVLDRKVSCGKTYLILKNTLNGFIRPSLAKLVSAYSPDESPAGREPLFTDKDAFAFLTLKEGGPLEPVTLVGNLCTAADVVAEDIPMPRLQQGDVVIITNAGSYGAVLSPMQFSYQEPPAELFLTAAGEVI